jgi:small subunit ribosomal protein S6
LRDYQLAMVLSPELDDDGVTGISDRVSQFVTQRGGTVGNLDKWGVRKLAYPLKKYQEGNYLWTEFTVEAQTVKELESSLKLWSEVLRYLLVKKEN